MATAFRHPPPSSRSGRYGPRLRSGCGSRRAPGSPRTGQPTSRVQQRPLAVSQRSVPAFSASGQSPPASVGRPTVTSRRETVDARQIASATTIPAAVSGTSPADPPPPQPLEPRARCDPSRQREPARLPPPHRPAARRYAAARRIAPGTRGNPPDGPRNSAASSGREPTAQVFVELITSRIGHRHSPHCGRPAVDFSESSPQPLPRLAQTGLGGVHADPQNRGNLAQRESSQACRCSTSRCRGGSESIASSTRRTSSRRSTRDRRRRPQLAWSSCKGSIAAGRRPLRRSRSFHRFLAIVKSHTRAASASRSRPRCRHARRNVSCVRSSAS